MKGKGRKVVSKLFVFLLVFAMIGFALTQVAVSQEMETREIRGYIALTFDDGPHPIYTPALLDAMQERNVRATFFVLGREVEKHPEIVARMYEEGHLIGNHSFNHRYLPYLDQSCIFEDLESTSLLIEEITGTRPNILRPPFGEMDDRVIDMV